MTHELKTVSPFFEEVESGFKTFEIRKNDRNYQVGDILVLRHWDSFRECFTSSRPVRAKVRYILQDERFLQPGYVCMAIDQSFSEDAP